jgi:cellulose synthase/poly-beta-1,6-N-acetylglucosamine synthase-like glycosyltransferase
MMSRLILSIFILMSNGVLFIFTLRRWLFLLTAWRLGDWESRRLESGEWRTESSPPHPRSSAPPSSILLLVPFRDEVANLRQLLPLLGRLGYPAECLTIVLVDDGSRDGSGCFCHEFIARRPNWHLLTLPHNEGKAAALNEALGHFPDGDFIAVFDADERPSPYSLTQLMPAFAEAQVGAVNGRRAVSNSLATPIASYAALENLVHQLITNRAKDHLQLAPALLGSNCIYRRAALTAVGGFIPGVMLEDSDLTVRLVKAGWRTRYMPVAVSSHAVPETLRGYWRQHTRWNAGFQQVAQRQAAAVLTQSRLPWLLRLELWLFFLGYLDRVALLAAVAGWWQRPSRLTSLNIGLSLLTPFLQIIFGLRLYGQTTPHPKTGSFWRRLGYLLLFYALDVAVVLVSIWHKVIRKPVHWEARGI